jgi:hypothetical protein
MLLLPVGRASVWRGDLKSHHGTCLATSIVRTGQERSLLPGGPSAEKNAFSFVECARYSLGFLDLVTWQKMPV